MFQQHCGRAVAGIIAAAGVIVVLAPDVAVAQVAVNRARPGNAPGGAGTTNLPYMVQDNMGNQWRIYQYGYLQQSGNMPLYSQGAMLMVNGNQPQMRANVARVVDANTGEIALENMQGQNGLSVTRRILIDRNSNVVRYVDVIKNAQGQDQAVQLMVQSSMNYSVTSASNVADPKRKDQPIAWVGQTGPNGNGTVLEMFSGKGTKSPMQIQYQPGNSQVQATMQATIPAGKEVAIVHLHGVFMSNDAAQQYAQKLKESDVLKSLPRELRKIVLNFPVTQGLVGDLELLRGDLLDVVELKTGDQLKGTLKEGGFELTTFYGPVTLPVDRVIAVLNVGQYRPRHLVVTTDGQIFGGRLKKETLDLQLSSGQVTQVPLSQVSRVGYRKRGDEPEEWTFDKPIVLMRTGERVGVRPPTAAMEVATRYGKLALRPEQVAAVILQSEEVGVHQVLLTDGSKFSGLLAAEELAMTLDAPGVDQVVRFPASSVSRFQLTPKVAEVGDDTSTVRLANEDLLVGTITGQLKLDTVFDTLTVNASEVKAMTHPKEGTADVQVVLWDGSVLSGQLQEHEVAVQLTGGVQMKVPVALIEEYAQPQPQPSDEMTGRIKKVIAELNSDDWKARDRAQATLTEMGPVAISVLKQLRDGQPPEAQKRIADVIAELERLRDKKPGGAGAPPTGR